MKSRENIFLGYLKQSMNKLNYVEALKKKNKKQKLGDDVEKVETKVLRGPSVDIAM